MSRALQREERVAAFFDLDGTLMAGPSLERRFFAMLRYRHAFAPRNYISWVTHAIRLAPKGIATVVHANKMYLRGVRVDGMESRGRETAKESRWRPAISLFSQAMERVAWHADQGHEIVLASCTLMPLAVAVGVLLQTRLAQLGRAVSVAILANQLEEKDGRWTGHIVGEPIFGEAKGRAIRQLARERNFDLSRCYAYGNSTKDFAMLDATGRPTAVNPSDDLKRIAQPRDWPILWWKDQDRRKGLGAEATNETSTRIEMDERGRPQSGSTNLAKNLETL
jgi:HAD superfamily hydrolase (TIGR01490 family)